MPTSVALGKHFEDFIRGQIAGGRYNNASEVVREGLRLMEDRESEKKAKIEALRAEIDKGLEGPFIPADEAFAEVRRRIEDVAKRKAG